MPVVRLFKVRLTALQLAPAALLIAHPAIAQDIRPIGDARLRYEHIDQDDSEKNADALTLRVRAGAEARWQDWSLLAEAEGTARLAGSHFSGLDGDPGRPLIADPENAELNRLQVQYRGLADTQLTIGRQRINLEDQRFVGSSGWRQNEQTFDAVRLEHGRPEGLRLDLAYSWSVRTIWGVDGAGARPQSIRGNNAFATISHPTPLGALSGFAFLVDQDDADVQAYRLSSQTYGLRLAGTRPVAAGAKLSYALSYAVQSDFHRNPNRYRSEYWLADLGLEFGPARLGIGHERLGADRGLPLTSFQTPLATLHRFQGWADRFLVTPPDGIRDWYASAGYGWKKIAGFDTVSASVTRHRFNADRHSRHYGSEWDALISARKGRWTITAKYGAYDADKFATDGQKLWLQLEWAY